jgi:thioredoxin 2
VAGPLPVLIVVSTPWCEPCRQLGLTVEQAASEFAGNLRVVTVNVDDAPAAVQRLGVQVVPTLVVLHHGKEAARRVGASRGGTHPLARCRTTGGRLNRPPMDRADKP